VSTKFDEKDIVAVLESGQYHTVFLEGKCVEPI